ncbi:unnamed protein product [Rhizoctonia solani]|uniref:Uncharacterized protein n=1 Tax=Rhizoctonia solani TaxID=456999 RepID=A0A8H2WF23_9AGAM|nr:unnamed protein product [Rhizoctonia solani]
MQSDSSLLSHPQRPANNESRPANRGVAVVRLVGRHIRNRLAWLLWVALGAAVLVGLICDGISWLYPYPENALEILEQIARGGRVPIIFSTFLFPRLADVHSRAASGLFALTIFLIGSILIAVGKSAPTFAAGMTLYNIGSSGLLLLPSLFISDHTSLRWRGIALAGIYFTPLITMWIEDPIFEHFSREWAIGTFAILMFAICAPALLILHSIASRQPEEIPRKRAPLILRVRDGLMRMDPVGLAVFTAGLALVDYNTEVWWGAEIEGRSKHIAMLIIGFILVFPVFAIWEIYFASFPIMPKWTFRNRGVLFAVMIAFCCRIATVSPMLAYRYYRKLNWSSTTGDYYLKSYDIARSVLAPVFGGLYLLSHRYKVYLLIGSAIFIVYSGLGLYSARILYLPEVLPSTTLLFAIQILWGVSEVAIDLGTTVGSQSSVPHDGLATLVGLINAITILAAAMNPSSSAAASL